MHTQFAQDLCVARRKAGLSTKDIAMLLELSTNDIADLERGNRPPSLLELCKISLVYNRSFESLYGEIRKTAKKELFQQMPSLSSEGGDKASSFNRENTLKRLHGQLIDDLMSGDGGS